jgi:hypothetical protein
LASGPPTDFAFLAEAARRSINDLRTAVDAARLDAGDRGGRFLEVVLAYLEALESAIDSKEADFAAAGDEDDRRSVIRETRLINHAIFRLHSYTPWIESTIRTVGLGLVYLVDDIVASLLKRPVNVVIAPDAVYM